MLKYAAFKDSVVFVMAGFISCFVLVRLESGNSIEEKLLKNGTKELIREVVAQGTDYSLAFLTQVRQTFSSKFYSLLRNESKMSFRSNCD